MGASCCISLPAALTRCHHPAHLCANLCSAVACLSAPEQQVLKNRAAAHYSCEIKDLPAHAVLGAGATGGILYWLAIFPGGCGRGGGCNTGQ